MRLQIPFDTRVANALMREEAGIALRMLYSIKQALGHMKSDLQVCMSLVSALDLMFCLVLFLACFAFALARELARWLFGVWLALMHANMTCRNTSAAGRWARSWALLWTPAGCCWTPCTSAHPSKHIRLAHKGNRMAALCEALVANHQLLLCNISSYLDSWWGSGNTCFPG